MNYGDVALGVECALPPRFSASAPKSRRPSFVWLLLGIATLAIL